MSKLQDYLDHNPELADETHLWKKSAAAALEVSEKTLERAAKNGKIAVIEKNRKILYLIEDLFNFEKDMNSEIHKPVIESDNAGQTPTNPAALAPTIAGVMQSFGQVQKNFPYPMSNNPDLESRLAAATVAKAEFEAMRAYIEGNLTFPLDELAERLSLSITDLKRTAKTFRGKNQRLMITRKSLDIYLDNVE